MASGSTIVNACFTRSGSVADALKFSWWESSQSVANNTTTVGWKLELISYKYGKISSTAKKDWSVTVNGQNYSGTNTIGIAENSTKELASGTTTITHNDDGAKSFSYSFSQYFGISFNGSVGTKSGSGIGTLTTIARASQPTLSKQTANFGETITIYTNRASTSFTHKVRYEFGSYSDTLGTSVTDSTNWTIPLSLMNGIPDSTSGSGRIYVDTYNGSTLIGTKYSEFTAAVPSTIKPSCTCTLDDTTGTDTIYGSPVMGLSKIKFTVSATTAYNSPIKSYSVTIDGLKYSVASATTGLLVNSGTSPVTVTVTDNRGRSGTWSYNMSVQDYAKPAITKLSVIRCNQNGTANKRGAYLKATFSATISSIDGKNTASYSIKYKKTTDSSYTTVELTALANNFAPANETYIFAASANSYDVVVSAWDRHNSSSPTTKSAKAPSASAIFSWRGFKNSSGTVEEGAGIGKTPEKPNTLQVGWTAEFEGDTALIGNTYSFQPGSFSGEKGYTLLAQITLNTLNVNAPIVFTINRRGALCPMTVYVCFASSSTTTDPGLGSITYEGDNYNAYLIKVAASTWKLYVDNTSGLSNPCLQSWYTTDNQMTCIAVKFADEQLAGTTTDVLKEASSEGKFYKATPVKMQSILDHIYPVGSIYLSYSHNDPSDLFGGTWERIENAFLWAVTETGVIGNRGNITATSGGSGLAFIQVSVWRRTA